ncbi:hypothetical protein MHK_010551, partial [Candidatus Magnetomorum sp. HK-1]
KWQFSCWLESDSNYDDVQNPVGLAWVECQEVAREVYYAESSEDVVDGSTHYYDKSLDNNPPSWASGGTRVEVENVLNLRFYKGVN